MTNCNPYRFRRYVSLIFLFIINGFSFSIQAQPKEIIFKHYATADGFNSSEAMSIAQTEEGLIWISTTDGLVRFDSKTFKYFRHNDKDSQSLSHNYCKAIQVDKRGWIWLVANEELDIFNPATETFTHLKHTSEKEENAQVKPRAFYYDKVKDIMWVATLHGLYFSKGGSAKLESVGKFSSDKTLAKDIINTIIAEGSNSLWLTSQNKIIKLNTGTGTTENYEIPQLVSGYNNHGKASIISSYIHKNKTLWLGTFTLGLFSFNTVSKQFDHYTYRDINKEDNTIFSITQTHLPDQENILFFGASGLGFGAFNIDTKKFTSYSSGTYKTSLGIKGNAYSLRCFDNKLWIGSSTGLHCYDYSLQLFEKKDLSSIANGSSLIATELMNVERNEKGKDERLWIFIPYKDGYIYDLVKNIILPIPSALKKFTAGDAGIFTMYIDNKNILWLGTNANGLVGYDIKKEIIITEKKYFFKENEWVHGFFEDSKNNLWLCTYNGLFVMDSSRNKVLPVTAVNELIKTKNLSTTVVGITEDEYGKIWLTTDLSRKKNAAIIKLDVSKNTAAIVYNEHENANNNITTVDLRGISSNKKGKIFVVFRSENISWFNSNSTGKIIFKVLEREQGLNNTSIDQLLSDAEGNVWVNNSLGIAQYKTSQNIFTNYSLADYELNTTNNPFIYLSPNTGNFYIGQSNSFLILNKNSSPNNIDKANLLFNDFKIYNKSSTQKIKDGDKITLSYQQDMISVEFALLSYSNSSENTYTWKLEGLEKDWNVSKNNIATYNHLVPGKYTLLVKAANSNGDWKTVPIKLYIKITPPFYATWWFKLLVFLLISGIIWWLVQMRIKRIKDKFALRNSIASDLHDEIGSTLTSISILSNVSQQAIDKQPLQAKELMQQLSNQTKTIQQNMSDIVWSIRPDNEKTGNLLVRIREYAAQTLEPLQINTVIEAEDSLIDKILPMPYRKDILLICKEAINNIAKHANACSVKICFSHTKKDMVISITDDGIWKGNNSGTGTKTMQERAKVLGGQLSITTTQEGTSIVVIIPLP